MPAPAKVRTMPRPMPEAPPVTTATRPSMVRIARVDRTDGRTGPSNSDRVGSVISAPRAEEVTHHHQDGVETSRRAGGRRRSTLLAEVREPEGGWCVRGPDAPTQLDGDGGEEDQHEGDKVREHGQHIARDAPVLGLGDELERDHGAV